MSFYEALISSTNKERQALLKLPFLQAVYTDKLTLKAYTAFLIETYHSSKHTVRLLMYCGSQLSESYDWLHEGIAEYIEEETDRHELILNDLKACGINPDLVRNGPPSQASTMLVAYAYDMIERINPLGLLGMLLVADELNAVFSMQKEKLLLDGVKLDKRAFTYLMSHGAVDLGFTDFLTGLINELNDPQDQDQVVDCTKMFYALNTNVLQAIQIPSRLNTPSEAFA